MLIPMILSGGSGTRLWPVSREAYPKPFIRLPDGASLLQKTLQRLSALPGVDEVLTITNREYYFAVRDEYKGTATAFAHRYLLEPLGRNTAPAIALGALDVAARHGEDATLLVLPADHLVQQHELFAAAVADAAALAEDGALVTFGIQPTHAETGFGYIECGEPLGERGFRVSRFVEKPSRPVAEQMLASGNFLWNSGMFCFRAGALIAEMERHAPEVLAGARACLAATAPGEEKLDLDRETFARVPEISIDYAVMEKSDRVAVVPGGFAWSDIGSWDAVSQLTAPDADGNRVQGEAVMLGARNCYVQAGSRMVAAVGLEDAIIVDTPDALLVARRDQVQNVKQVAQQLKLAGHPAHRLHTTVTRPWGTYTVLEQGPSFKIKRIVVKPGASLSLQMHYHRSEHWVVVAGTAKVVNGEGDEFLVRTNESTFIPAGNRHRLANPGKVDLAIIEVQSGPYLEEDDIVRFDDVYGRS